MVFILCCLVMSSYCGVLSLSCVVFALYYNIFLLCSIEFLLYCILELLHNLVFLLSCIVFLFMSQNYGIMIPNISSIAQYVVSIMLYPGSLLCCWPFIELIVQLYRYYRPTLRDFVNFFVMVQTAHSAHTNCHI